MKWQSWRLIVTSTPFALAIVALAYARIEVLRIGPVATLSEMGSVITATVLITGFMLAGVLADHKESERLPNQLTSQLQGYAYALDCMIAINGEDGAPEMRSAYKQCVSACEKYFLNVIDMDACLAAIDNLNLVAARSKVTEGSAVSNYSKVAFETLPKIRETIGRIDTIRNTGFLPSGYALLKLMAAVAIGLLVFADVKVSYAEYFIVGIVSLVMIVLIRLITDLDDPFHYADGRFQSGSNEINPYSIVDFSKRVSQRLEVDHAKSRS